MSTTSVSQTLWNVIRQQSADTVFATQFYAFNGGGTDVGHGLLSFTLPSSLGTITKLEINFPNVQGDFPGNASAYKLTRAFTASATWNKYDGTNSWTTPGGDIGSALDTKALSAGLNLSLDVTGSATWGETVYFEIKDSQNNFHEKTNTINLVITYTSVSAPTVTTQAVSDITNTTATGNGNVTADGGATITERGVCIGASANPTTSGTKFTTTGTTGAFTVSMTSLTKNTHYHARAYAINSQGTSYGADVEFDTTNLPSELRDFTNKPGAVYDANKTTVIYAEDMALLKEWIEYLANNL